MLFEIHEALVCNSTVPVQHKSTHSVKSMSNFCSVTVVVAVCLFSSGINCMCYWVSAAFCCYDWSALRSEWMSGKNAFWKHGALVNEWILENNHVNHPTSRLSGLCSVSVVVSCSKASFRSLRRGKMAQIFAPLRIQWIEWKWILRWTVLNSCAVHCMVSVITSLSIVSHYIRRKQQHFADENGINIWEYN